MKPGFPYEPLGPRKQQLMGKDSLWMGEEHLLFVRNRRYVEEYFRFDYREIQAIVVRRKSCFVVSPYWLLACFAALVAAIAGTVSLREWLKGGGWILFAVLVLYWLGSSIFESCSCHLQTAVGLYELTGLYRMRSARKAIAILESRITAVQGVLPEEWSMPLVNPPPLPDSSVSASGTSRTRLPALACFIMLVDALFSWINRNPGRPRIVQSAGGLITVVAIVMAAVAMVATRKDSRLRSLRILLLAAVLGVGVANYGVTVASSFAAAMAAAGGVNPAGSVNDFFYWLNQITEISLGLLGLYQTFELRRGYPSAP